jgi:hypothetical protein
MRIHFFFGKIYLSSFIFVRQNDNVHYYILSASFDYYT